MDVLSIAQNIHGQTKLWMCAADPVTRAPLSLWTDVASPLPVGESLTDGDWYLIAQTRAYYVKLSPEWIVIDLDAYKPEASASFQQFLSLCGLIELPETFTVATPRGGFHYWFRNPYPERCPIGVVKTLSIGGQRLEGLEFLSLGCIATGPGSRRVLNEEEMYYRIEKHVPCAKLPVEVVEVLSKRERILDAPPVILAPDTAEMQVAISVFREYLKNTPTGERGNRDIPTFNAALKGRDYGLPEATTFALLTEWDANSSYPWTEADLYVKVRSAYNSASMPAGNKAPALEEFHALASASAPIVSAPGSSGVVLFPDRLESGKLKPTRRNLRDATTANELWNPRINAMEANPLKGLFAWDYRVERVAFTRKPVWRSEEDTSPLAFNTTDAPSLALFLADRLGVDFSSTMISEVVMAEAAQNRINPLTDWLNGLVWDGQERLRYLFTRYFNRRVSNREHLDYLHALAQAFVVASVMRAVEPGCKWDNVLVLAGPQGLGKSPFVSIMGGQYASELTKMSSDKDSLQEMDGSWWIEYPELSAYSKQDVDAIKAFISKTCDKFRRSYASTAVERPRSCVMVWTLNPKRGTMEFLRDETGNRRFLIVGLDKNCDLDYKLLKQDREQIFAEAVALYNSGVRPYDLLTPVLETSREVQAKATVDQRNGLEEAIHNWVASGAADQVLIDKPGGVPSQHIGTIVLGLTALQLNRVVWSLIRRTMAELGWQYIRTNYGTVYRRVSPESIEGEDNGTF